MKRGLLGIVFRLMAAVAVVMTSSAAFSQPTTYLSPEHRVYEFLDIMTHRFPMTNAFLATKPMTRADAARLVFSLEDKRRWMSSAEREELDCLLDEFAPDRLSRSGLIWQDEGPIERMPGFLKDVLYRNRRNFFSASGGNYTLFLDPVVTRQGVWGKTRDGKSDDNVYTSGNGFLVRGTIGDHVGYHVDVRDSKEWGSRTYPENTSTTMPGRGYVKYTGDSAEFDETYAHLTYSQGPFILTYGRDRSVWGYGSRGTLLLSGYGAPYDMVRLETAFRNIRFVFFTAELEQYPPIAQFYYSMPEGVPADSVTVKKRLSGHRIEFAFGDRLMIGLHETVVYGGRWDMAYLNPVMFLKGAEHANGDHDNAAMGADFQLFINRAHSIYGELLIDDITTTKLGTDWYGNKLGYQIGTFLVRPLGIHDLDVRAEYTRIKPWVYTHRMSLNSYTHYGDVLGHPLGPNSDELTFQVRRRFSRRLHTSLTYSKGRHGDNTADRNVGGDPLDGFGPGDSENARFLDGIRSNHTSYAFDMSYEIAWQLFCRAGYARESYDGDGFNVYRFSIGLNE